MGGSTNAAAASDVYFFAHKDMETTAAFTQLVLANQRTLEATAEHFVPVSSNCDGAHEMKYAGDVKVGMCMFSLGQSSKLTEMVRVEAVNKVERQGLHAPYTMSGTLFVNGVLASSHSDWFLDPLAKRTFGVAVLPSLYQHILAPARAMYNLVERHEARAALEAYQQQMNAAADQQMVLKPYLDLFWQALKIRFSSSTPLN
jgi:hypothetical protein